MESRYIVLGDIVASSRVVRRRLLQQRLARACRAANRTAAGDLFAPFKTLKGVDEVGGALMTAHRAYDVLCVFLDTLRPYRTRSVLVFGAVDVGLATHDVARMDGPVFRQAAGMMAQLKKSGLVFAAAVNGAGFDACLSGLGNLLLTLRSEWTERQRVIVTGYQAAGSQRAAAERLGISQQAVSKTLRSIHWRVFSTAEEAMRRALQSKAGYLIKRPG